MRLRLLVAGKRAATRQMLSRSGHRNERRVQAANELLDELNHACKASPGCSRSSEASPWDELNQGNSPHKNPKVISHARDNHPGGSTPALGAVRALPSNASIQAGKGIRILEIQLGALVRGRHAAHRHRGSWAKVCACDRDRRPTCETLFSRRDAPDRCRTR